MLFLQLTKNKTSMKYLILIFISLSMSINSFSQGINDDKVSLTNFIKRMYTSTPFEGVKIMEDYDKKYLVSVISFDKSKYPDPSILNRIAQVKAQSQSNTYINGASTNSDIIIKTIENKSKDELTSVIETIEIIKQNSVGFTKGLELLTNFESIDTKRFVFIYFREIESAKNKM
jgi:hypothetical protein